MIKQILPDRNDPAGDGAYGAPRSKILDGERIEYTHRGVDKQCVPGGLVCAPLTGLVTKLGYAYANDLKWRYIEVKDHANLYHRFFYVRPIVKKGEFVFLGSDTAMGYAQDITERYPDSDMTPHIHYEVFALSKHGQREYVNPVESLR